MNRTSEVVHGGVLIQVRVFNDTQRTELLEYPVHSRGAHVGPSFLDFLGNFVGGHMVGRVDQYVSEGSFGDGYPLGGGSDRRD